MSALTYGRGMPAVFRQGDMVAIMQRLYVVITKIVVSSGDIAYDEFMLLACAAEQKFGLTSRQIREQFPCSGNATYFADRLVQKELLERFRTRSDRRSLSFRPTQKGLERLSSLDRFLMTALVLDLELLTEEQMEYLAERMFEFSQAPTDLDFAASTPVTVFPGAILRLFQCYHRALGKAASRFGMTASQAASLCALGCAGASSRISFARQLELCGLMPTAAEIVQDDAINKAFISEDDPSLLLERGIARVDDLMRAMNMGIDSIFGTLSPACEDAYEMLGDSLRYLFS